MPDAPSLRETLEAAVTSSQDPAPEPEVEAPAVEAAEPAPAPEPKEEAAPSAAERARDERGRFKPAGEPEAAPQSAKKAEPVKTAAPGQAKAGGVEAPPTTPPAAAVEPAPVKAPQSWKPQVRELAAKLPAEFKPILDEVNRREVETSRALQETANARRLAEQVHQALSPFEGVARANGMDALAWAESAVRDRAVLAMGSPQQKAQLLARAIRESGTDIEMLAAALDGAPAQGPQQPAAPPVNIQAEVQRAIQSQVQHAQRAKAEREMTSFLEAEHEFIEAVGPDMHGILLAAGSQGRNLTPQEAYDRACWMNPDVREVLEKRKAVEAAKAQAPSVAQAKRAAVSVKAAPAEPVKTTEKRSLREELEAAAAAATRT